MTFPAIHVLCAGFAFGVRQDEHVVHDVQLPAWANNDPRLFILRHREVRSTQRLNGNTNHVNCWLRTGAQRAQRLSWIFLVSMFVASVNQIGNKTVL